MSTYAVGDIQGCLEPLQALLIKINFSPAKDSLWVAGDLINRGPESLQTLRLLYHLRDSSKIVLGNHDLHLLASAAGYRSPTPSDTINEIITAPDRDVLLEWLRQQPLVHHDKSLGYTMVHAGIPPQWSIKDALTYSAEIEAVLRSNKIVSFFKHMYGNNPDRWDEKLKGHERWRLITNYFTRMRFCDKNGRLELNAKTVTAPKGFSPWFTHSSRKTVNDNILFGHWAALKGITHTPKVFALDTGCVWGGELTMMRLEDQKRFYAKY